MRQFLEGNGPNFNAFERAEPNTSTLWAYLLILFAAVTRLRIEYLAVFLGIALAVTGLALGMDKGGYVAACAEVAIDPVKRAIKVRHVCQAFDCGKITSPSNLKSQIMGAIIMGLGPALREAMRFENGKITNASFFSYEVPRISDVPTLDIQLVDRPDAESAGAGETPLIVIAPAIRNAVHDATKQWLREMPLRMSSPI